LACVKAEFEPEPVDDVQTNECEFVVWKKVRSRQLGAASSSNLQTLQKARRKCAQTCSPATEKALVSFRFAGLHELHELGTEVGCFLPLTEVVR
jgi:hypothetical protein